MCNDKCVTLSTQHLDVKYDAVVQAIAALSACQAGDHR
jgi:hypothetical protein